MKRPKQSHSADDFRVKFENACAVFATPLTSHGFVLASVALESTYGSQSFVSGARYVKISATVDPRDAPYFASVALGEGDTRMPESDWNSIALWRLVERVAPNEHANGAGSYSLQNADQLLVTFERMLADLLRFASNFLSGDVQEFRRIRAALVKTRKPYTIHRPDAAGHYSAHEDPETAALKKRFSRED